MTELSVSLSSSHEESPPPFIEAIGEICSGILYLLNDIGTYATGVAVQVLHHNTENYPTLKKVVNTVRAHWPAIQNSAFSLALFYHFWCAKSVFCIFFTLGTLLSVPHLPSHRYFPALQTSLYGKTEEQHSQFKHAIIICGVVNCLLKRAYIANLFFGILVGLMGGHAAFHASTEVSKKVIVNLTNTLVFPNFFDKGKHPTPFTPL